MTRFTAAIAALVLLAFTAPAFADPGDDQRAKALWVEGANRYDLGDYAEAARLFRDAYTTWPFPEILFNLCQAHRQLKQYEDAIRSCRTYLDRLADADNRDMVRELIAEMTELAARQTTSNEKPPEGVELPPHGTRVPGAGARPARTDSNPTARSPDARAEPWYADTTGWVVSGAGVVGVAVGLGVYAGAGGLDDQADIETDIDEIDRLRDQASARRLLGGIFTAAGAVTLATGITLLWIHDPEADTSVHVVASPTSIDIRGTF